MQIIAAIILALTAGWENVDLNRTEPSATKVLWRADFTQKDSLKWEFRDGAEGTVEMTAGGLRIEKTNDRGLIVVKGQPFQVVRGQGVRFFADAAILDADVDFSSAYLRYHGSQESLEVDGPTENQNSAQGGVQVQRGMPCTAPGMTFRKYAQCTAKDDRLTPVLVVAGVRSLSVWKQWGAEDLTAAQAAFKEYAKTTPGRVDHTDRIRNAAATEARWAADPVDHIARVERRDGVARLVLDGDVVAPVIYKAEHVHRYWLEHGNCNFAGERLDGGPVRLMCVSFDDYGGYNGQVGADGFKKFPALDELKKTMLLAPNSLFVVGLEVRPPRDLISKHHPDEAWLDEKGQPVWGRCDSCIVGYHFDPNDKSVFMWPSFASPAWRGWVKAKIREFVEALKASGLSKRVVGAHLYGFHDGQMTVCYTDYSKCAKEAYRQIISEPDCLSTNYAFCTRLFGQLALNDFAREFKRAMGKDVIAIKWCESPFQGKRAASTDLTTFTRCDAIDMIVCQPTYAERFPAFPSVSALPMDSLHLHGKIYLNELDLRTWKRPVDGPYKASFVTMKGISTLEDLPMWRASYRKFAGEAAARRMGYWLYDIKGGRFDDDGIAADIGLVVNEETALARQKPSRWRPDVAVVIDEAQFLRDSLDKISDTDHWLYSEGCRYLGSCGAPYESWLMQDVLDAPSLLDGRKLAVFAFVRNVDARRDALLKRLAEQGTTLVFLSETGLSGTGMNLGFKPYLVPGEHSRVIVPEKGVTDNLSNALSVLFTRAFGDAARPFAHRCSVWETPDVKVLARYASDARPALTERIDGVCRRVYVSEPSGLTPGLLNRLVRESGGYAAVNRAGLQVDMNGDFVSVHCLRPGHYDFKLPFPCRMVNLKTGMAETVRAGSVPLELTAGESCRFRLEE